VYLHYAANAMCPSAGKQLAKKLLEQWMIEKDPRSSSYGNDCTLLAGSSSACSEFEARQNITANREKGTNQMDLFLSAFHTVVSEGKVQVYLDKLLLDPSEVLSNVARAFVAIPSSACTTNHRDVLVVYKCSRCRETIGKASNAIGGLLAIRQHGMTDRNPYCEAIGFNANANAYLREKLIHPAALEAILAGISPEMLKRLEATTAKPGGAG